MSKRRNRFENVTNTDEKNVINRRDRKALNEAKGDMERRLFENRNAEKVTIITINKGDDDMLSGYAFVKLNLSKPINARELGLLIIDKIGDYI